jgi:hypothetical protein
MAELLTPWEAFLVHAPIFDDDGCECEQECTCGEEDR